MSGQAPGAGQARGTILVTPRSLTQAGVERVAELAPLRAAGYGLRAAAAGRTPSEQELVELLPGCVGWIAGVEPISARVIAGAPQLRVISRNGTGVDSIDLDAARRGGVRVERAVGANARGVAELTVALTLCALRHVTRASATVRAGNWERWQGRELADLTVGVVGLGAVGSIVARLFDSLGSAVIGHDPNVAALAGVENATLDDLTGRSDVMTLHCPMPNGGQPLVNDRLLGRTRGGAVLVNTARAGLVDEVAVLRALGSGALGAYAVDVFDVEPPPSTDLLRHERVIATPHIGGFTDASVRRATEAAVANLLSALGDGKHG